MLAYIPYMDPMGMEKSWVPQTSTSTTSVSDRARRHSANHEIRCPRHKWWGPGRIFTSIFWPLWMTTQSTHTCWFRGYMGAIMAIAHLQHSTTMHRSGTFSLWYLWFTMQHWASRHAHCIPPAHSVVLPRLKREKRHCECQCGKRHETTNEQWIWYNRQPAVLQQHTLAMYNI